MDWNDEEYAHLRNAMGRHASPEEVRASLEAIASCAVSLYIARASGQVKEDEAFVRSVIFAAAALGTGTADHLALSRLAQEAEVLRASVRDMGERLVLAGGSRDGAVLEQLNLVLERGATERESLRAKVAEMEEDNRRLEDERNAAETSAGDADAQRDAASEDLAAARAEVERLKATADELQRQRDLRGGALEVARAEVERLESQVVAEREYRDERIHEVQVPLRAEVERLKVVKETTDEVEAIARRERDRAEERARFAESRLAAIRERAKDGTRMRREYLAAYDKDPNWQPYQAAVAACLQVALWVLDGDAPNSSMLSKGSGEATNAALLDPMGDGPICVCAKGWKPCVAPRHPCSTTCTHDDAANPGHPELVKAQSVAVARAAAGLPETKERGAARISVDPEVCSHNVHYRDTCGDCEYERGNDAGAEAMRAACLREAKEACDTHGVGWLYQHLKRLIERAAP